MAANSSFTTRSVIRSLVRRFSGHPFLTQAFPQGFILAEGEFSKLEQVVFGAPLEMTNKYLNAVAYYEVRGPPTISDYIMDETTLSNANCKILE